jgi:UDP-N-acetylglucosamine acyltransferase
LSIHPTAIVAPGAVVPESCTIGPFCTIGPDVVMGENCELVSHVVVEARTTLGNGVRITSFACVGIEPQDLKYRGEQTRVEVGDKTVIREYVTISRGTAGGGGLTKIGSGCLIMAYCHIGHDSQVGMNCIMANNATLAGHVIVEDYAVVGAFSPVHQFCRVGRHAYIGGGTITTQDVMPFTLISNKRDNHAYGLNRIGLERRGFTPEQLKELRVAYRLLTNGKMNVSDALAELRAKLDAGEAGEHVRYLVEFVSKSERGIIR